MTKTDLYKLHRSEYVTPKEPALVEAGAAKYLTAEGEGAPGGETPAEVGARADRVLASMRTPEGQDPLSVIVFAHGHLLRVLAARWIGMEVAGGGSLALSAAGIGVLGHERETPVLERWNATAL